MSRKLPYSVSQEYFGEMTARLESIPSKPRRNHNIHCALTAAAIAMTIIAGSGVRKQMAETEMDEALEYILESGMPLAQIEESIY